MIKKLGLYFYNYLLSMYIIICTSFLYKQYLTVLKVNVSQYTDFIYFIKDNSVLIILFLLILFSILSNLFYITEYWVFTTKDELNIKRIIGYTYNEIVVSYYWQFISLFFIVFSIAAISCIPILHYFNLPILIPMAISCICLIVILSVLIVTMMSYCLSKYKKGAVFGFKYTKKIVIVFQFSISLLLVFVALTLFNDINQRISPYKNYIALDEAWILKASFDSVEEAIEADRNPEKYRGDILEKIEKIYSEYEYKIIVYYPSVANNSDIGRVVYLNEKSLEINNIDSSIFDPFLDSKEVPIILGHTFYGVYSIGDIIQSRTVDYVVAKVLSPGEILDLLGPNEFAENSSAQYNFALFDHRLISKELSLNNTNFLNTLFFFNISEEEINAINAYINEDTFTYAYESIKSVQEDYYLQKTIALSGYLAVGSINLLFSILGLICIVYVDINSKELEFSIYKLVGYTNKAIYSKYLMSILIVLLMSFVIAQFLAYVSLKFSAMITSIVALIVIVIFSAIAFISIFFINNIKAVEIIGGENV